MGTGRARAENCSAGGDRAQTTAALTRASRAALDGYTAVLRQLPGVAREDHRGTSTRRALAMLTGTRLPRPWVSTSRKAG
jgi:hypothetical protein